MFTPPPPLHNKKWMRHTAMVPKGFLRYHVLKALSQTPMSGSELIEEIEKHTGGCWKPSPGSIYPLLSWLQDNNYIKELPSENGLKRYELTSSGKSLLEEQGKIRQKFTEHCFLPSQFFDSLFTKVPPEKTADIHRSLKRLAIAFFQFGSVLQDDYSEQSLDESLKIINSMAQKFEELAEKAKKDGTNE
jgi:DNA-binding PadR family transcriptional regulator